MARLVTVSRNEIKDVAITDPLGEEDEIQPTEYRITSYGADYPVQMLVTQLDSGDIYTPEFQRGYVWDRRMASRFIESLLLGLPVPGIFLSVETQTERHLIIDGQQRLKTLQFFFQGIFEPDNKSFALAGVQKTFSGTTFKTLSPEHRRRLTNSVIHATIVKQDVPSEDESSIFHIFERLNSGGKQLAPQEIRSALFNGGLVKLLREINTVPAWREIYGPVSPQQRDIELIVRFLSFYSFSENYAAPMKTFLNRYMGRNRELAHQGEEEIRRVFIPTINLAQAALTPRPFRPQRALNAAVFDAVMVALARRLDRGPIEDLGEVSRRYNQLLDNDEFVAGIVRATANEQRVAQRHRAATAAFQDVP